MSNQTKLMTVKEAIITAMSEEMKRDENVFLIGEDVGIFGGDFGTSVGMLEEFGSERIKDTPISESAISGTAIGAAMTGLRPIVDVTFMDFIVYMMDNIVNQAAKTRYMFGGKGQVPVTFRCAAGSGVGSAAQHSQSLESSAIRDNNPVIFLEYKAQYNMKGEVPIDPDFIIPLGKGEIKKEGTDITIVTYGRMLERVIKAAEEVEKDGINVEVVDPRTLIPLDKELILNSVKKTGKVILVNDAHKTNGFIGEISAMISESEAFDFLDSPIVRLASEDVPVPYNHTLETAIVPSVEKIINAIYKVMNKQ